MASKQDKVSHQVTILIVEDSPTQALQLQHLLEEAEYQVLVSQNGQEALALLKNHQPTIIVSDILMPGMNGFELCKNIKHNESLRNIPVVLLTSLSDPHDVIKGLECGASNFITKPYEEKDLLNRLRYILINQELRKGQIGELAVEVYFAGKKYNITADRMQIIDLLFSTYENAVQKNRDLIQINKELADTQQELKRLNEQLEKKVTERTQKLKELNKVILAIRNVNQLIVKEKNRDKLIKETCKELIESRYYQSAWIVLLDDSGALQAGAEAGLGEEFGPLFNQLKHGEVLPCFQEALNQSEPVIIADPLLTCTHCLYPQKHPHQVGMAVRLEQEGKVYGVLSVSSSPDVAQDKEEQSLFKEVAGDIAFAFYSIELDEQRKRAEKEVRDREEELASIYDNAPLIMLLVDENWKILKTNAFTAQFVGTTVGNMVNMRCGVALRCVHALDNPEGCGFGPSCKECALRLTILNTIETGSSHSSEEISMSFSDGEKEREAKFLLSAKKLVIKEQSMALVSLQDITERTQAEELFRSLATNLPVGVYIAQKGKFVYTNPQFQQDNGYREDELLGMEALSLVFPEDRETVRNNAIQMVKGKRIVPYEYRITNKNGEIKWVLESVGSIRHQGKQATISSCQDITERKQAEEQALSLQSQLRQSQKMESIGRLAGGIAHDFNNLLTVISIQSQLALGGLREGDPLKEKLQDIEQAADRAANLTRQLLAFSRRQILDIKVLNLNTIVSNLEKMLQRIIGEDLELASILADDLGMVKVDPGQMEQVIVNLAVNAKDAMPQGGKLTIETTNVELDEGYTCTHMGVMPGAYVLLSVSDTGEGMTKQVKEQIFDPFFTTKEKGKGTGLGLSTVYGIVKQSGGDILVYTEVGHGTTFKIYFPRVFEPGEELAKKEADKEVPRGEETILVVEDDDMVRKLAVVILKNQGYMVLEAPEGGEALLVCEQYKEPIHLFLTDVVMPHMSGAEFIERLKQVREDFKVLYMTGYTENAITYHGILDKRVNLIQKPFTVEKLARKVREVLDEN